MTNHFRNVQLAMEICAIFSAASSLLVFALILLHVVKIPEDKEQHRLFLLAMLIYDLLLNIMAFFGAFRESFAMCVAYAILKIVSLLYITFVLGLLVLLTALTSILLAFAFAGMIANDDKIKYKGDN